MADQTLGSEIDIKLEPGPVGLSSRRIGSGRRRIHEEGKQQCLWLGTGPEAESVLRQFKEVERREGFKQHKTFLSHLLTTYSNRSNSLMLPLQPHSEAAPCPQSPKPPMSVSKREECSQVLGDLVVTSNSSLDNRVWLGMKSTPSDFLRGQDPAMASSNEMGHRIGVLATPLSFPAPYHHPFGSVRHNEDGPSDFAEQPLPLSYQPQPAGTYSQPRPLSYQPQAAGTYSQPHPLSHQPQPTDTYSQPLPLSHQPQPTGTYSQPLPLSHQPQPTGTYSQLHPMLSCSPMAQHMPGPMQHPDHPHNISISQDFHGGLTPQDQLSQLVEGL